MTKRGVLTVILSFLLGVSAFVACGEEAHSEEPEAPSTESGAGDEVVEPTDPVNGFLIRLETPNKCCKLSKTVVEVKRGEKPITLPTPECEYDEHTFKYWKLDGEQLVRVSDIWSRIDENATEITLTAYCRRNWTNNH